MDKRKYIRKQDSNKDERLALGQSMRVRRRILGLTQEQVATQLKMSATAYSKIERGESSLTMDRMKQITTILGICETNSSGEIPTGNMLIKEIYLNLIAINKKMEVMSNVLVAEPTPTYETSNITGEQIIRKEGRDRRR